MVKSHHTQVTLQLEKNGQEQVETGWSSGKNRRKKAKMPRKCREKRGEEDRGCDVRMKNNINI